MWAQFWKKTFMQFYNWCYWRTMEEGSLKWKMSKTFLKKQFPSSWDKFRFHRIIIINFYLITKYAVLKLWMILGMQIRKPFQVDSPVFPWVWSILVDAADECYHKYKKLLKSWKWFMNEEVHYSSYVNGNSENLCANRQNAYLPHTKSGKKY